MRKSTILIQVIFSKLPCNNNTYFRQTSVLLIPEYQYLILFRTEYLRPPSTCQQILLFLFQQSRPFAFSLWVIVGCPKNTTFVVYNVSLTSDFTKIIRCRYNTQTSNFTWEIGLSVLCFLPMALVLRVTSPLS